MINRLHKRPLRIAYDDKSYQWKSLTILADKIAHNSLTLFIRELFTEKSSSLQQIFENGNLKLKYYKI